MNGAEALARTLLQNDIKTCFVNPGTSEMHFVAALDTVQDIRCVLGLHESTVTGAADGYFRMRGVPAATLLHLGPGLANGLSNLHNAGKAKSGIVNIVGDHATYHLKLGAPLTSDIEGIARPVSDWVHTVTLAEAVSRDATHAIAEARKQAGKIATLILPADAAWNECPALVSPLPIDSPTAVSSQRIDQAAACLKSRKKTALLLGGHALREDALRFAGQIAAKTGCRLLCENLNARLQKGIGRVEVERIPYAVDAAIEMLKDIEMLILVGAKAPIAFFAYPAKKSILTDEAVEIVSMADVDDDILQALDNLVDALGARNCAPAHLAVKREYGHASGKITPEGIATVLAQLMPENAVVVDESITTGRRFGTYLAGAKPHDWLNSMGGSIGFGLPLAIGAAIAAPERKIIALEGDGSAMYSLQALWTMVREQLDITVMIFANHSYQILHGELAGVGARNPGPRALDMLTLDRPRLDWQSLGRGHGIASTAADTLGELSAQLQDAFTTRGPKLIEARM